MPKNGSHFRAQAQHVIFNVHQLSVNEIDSSNRFIQCDVSRARSRKCQQGGQLIECGLGTNSMLSQPIALLATWKHSWQISNIAPSTMKNTMLTGYEKFHSLVRMVKNSLPRQRPVQITRRSNHEKKQTAKHRSFWYTFLRAAPKQVTGVTTAIKYQFFA